MTPVLILLDETAGVTGWLKLTDGAIVRGSDLAALELSDEDRLVAVAPGNCLSLHWLDLDSALTPLQAAAAARLLLSEQSAQPIGEMHVAVGREVAEEPGRCAALVPAATMESWLLRLGEAGIDPAAIVPDLLLLPVPDEGLVRYEKGSLALFRGNAEAFALEPDVAELVVAGRPVASIDGSVIDSGLGDLIEDPLLDLRQGPFARRRPWRVDPALTRRLILLGLALVLVTLAIQVASILRYTFGADALEAETRRIAVRALPHNPGIANPAAELADRLAELRGGGLGYGATSAAVFAAVKATPNVELNGLNFSPDGSLRATLAADNPATLDDVARRVRAAGFAAELGPPRSGGGRRVADLEVRP